LEKAVASLEGEKRSEKVACWKDSLALRNDLTEAIAEYLSIQRKARLLGLDYNNKNDRDPRPVSKTEAHSRAEN
ncbi:hypothetical protein BVY01_04285, partial [bacterium I07]